MQQEVTMVKAPMTVIAAIGAMILGTTPSAQAKVDVHVGIGIPAPPAVVFESEPPVVLVPGTQVYYLANPDYDLYRYGGYYYVNRDGYWYRSRGYRGPFAHVEYDRVPRQIVVVPENFHHYPVHPSDWHPGPRHHAPHPPMHAHGPHD
jgi:hypothetical protein